jgi:hypothetical protein
MPTTGKSNSSRAHDRHVDRAAALGQHVEHGGGADGGFGAGGNVGHTIRGRHRQDLGAGACHQLGRRDKSISDAD